MMRSYSRPARGLCLVVDSGSLAEQIDHRAVPQPDLPPDLTPGSGRDKACRAARPTALKN
jgi:hypothetical protein